MNSHEVKLTENQTPESGAETQKIANGDERTQNRGSYRGNGYKRGRGNRPYAPRGSYNSQRGAYRGQDGGPRRYYNDGRYEDQEGAVEDSNTDDFYNRKPVDRFNARGRGGRGRGGRGGYYTQNRPYWEEAHQPADDYEPASDEEVVELTRDQMDVVKHWQQYSRKSDFKFTVSNSLDPFLFR